MRRNRRVNIDVGFELAWYHGSGRVDPVSNIAIPISSSWMGESFLLLLSNFQCLMLSFARVPANDLVSMSAFIHLH